MRKVAGYLLLAVVGLGPLVSIGYERGLIAAIAYGLIATIGGTLFVGILAMAGWLIFGDKAK